MDPINFNQIIEDNIVMDRIALLCDNYSENAQPNSNPNTSGIEELPLDQYLSRIADVPGLDDIPIDESMRNFDKEELAHILDNMQSFSKPQSRFTVMDELTIIDALTNNQNKSQPSYRNCNLEDSCNDSTVIHKTLDRNQIYELNETQVHQYNCVQNLQKTIAVTTPSSSSQLFQNTGMKISKTKKFTENNSENVILPYERIIEIKKNGKGGMPKVSKTKLEDVTLKLQNKSSDILPEHVAFNGNMAYSLLSKRLVTNNYAQDDGPSDAYDRSDHTYHINPNRGKKRRVGHWLPTPTDSEGEVDVETVQGPILILPTKPTRRQQMAIQLCMQDKISSERPKPSSSYTPLSATPGSGCFSFDRTSNITSSSASMCDPSESAPLLNFQQLYTINEEIIEEEVIDEQNAGETSELDDTTFVVPAKRFKRSKKKVVKSPKNEKLELSKRNDHNRKERNRRDVLKSLFENLLTVMQQDSSLKESTKWSKNLILKTAKAEIGKLMDTSEALQGELKQLEQKNKTLKRKYNEM